MARRRFTNIILALGLLCSIVASIRVEAQAVTFAITPTQITPAVGDIVSLNVTAQNFTNIVSFQYAIEWDGALMSFVSFDSLNVPDAGAFGLNPFGGNTAIVGWSSVGSAKSVPNGHRLFKLRLRVLAASSNYWAKFSNTNIDIEVIQDPGLQTIKPVFGSLGIPPGASAVPLVAKATGGSTLTGQKVCVPITTSDFTNVVSAQWVNKWNPAVLRFDSVSALNSTLGLRTSNFGTTQAGNGRMTFSWNAPSGSVSVPNDALLYNVCYTAVGGNGTSSNVTFDSAEVYRRSAVGDTRVSLNGTNATVTVGSVVLPPTTGLIFTASNEIVASGDSVCVKIRTAGFNNVASMQWSMHFDSTKMTLGRATSTAPIGINTSIPGDLGIPRGTTGTLTFVWISNSGLGVSVPDSTILMEICFKYIGAVNTSSPFRFDGIPTKMKVSDGSDTPVTIPSTFRAGSVSSAVAAVTGFTGTTQNVSCPSGTDGKITLSPTGGNGTYTYSWTGPNGFTASTKDVTARTAGAYSVTVSSNGTTKTDNFNITEPTAFALSTQVINVSCKGGANGAITLTPAGGTAPYTYNWAGTTSTPTAKDLLNLKAGVYKLTLTDAKNCTTTREETVTEPAAALVATAVATNLNCKDGASGTIVTTPTGGTAPYTYNWSGTTSTPTAKDLSGLAAGVYNLTVTDAKSCTTTLTQTLTEPDGIKVGTGTIVGTRCSEPIGTITVTAPTGGSGGYTYSWAGPSNPTSTSLSVINILAGAYVLTVKDSKGCEAKATFTVTDVAANITTAAPSVINTTCFGGQNGEISVSAISPNPLTYAWTGPNGFTATTLNIRNLFAGNYTLTIKDGTCSKTVSATVNDAAAIVSSPQSVNVKCKGLSTGSIALNTTGGTGALSIAWTGPNGFTGTGQSIGSLAAGTYTAIITDASSCKKTETITLTEPSETVKITNAVIKNAACTGDSNGGIILTVAGGTPQYTYAWTGVGTFPNTQKDVTNVLGGEYRVTVSDANGCTASGVYTVVNPAPLVVNSGTTDAAGTPNGTISLNPTGGTVPYRYLWTGQGVVPTAQNQTGLCSGTYSVNVSDSAGCSASKTITVGGSCSTPMRVLGTVTPRPAGCSGSNAGEISINWEGGVAPFTVVWVQIINTNAIDVFSQVVQARNSVLVNRPAGTYAVKITDAVGQTLATPPMIINGSSTPVTLTAAISDETCRGADGSIAITIGSGGAAPFELAWLDNNLANNVYDRRSMIAGTYAVKVTDANKCIKEMGGMVIKKTPCPLVVTSTKVNPTCFDSDNGSITIEITNGEPQYTVTVSSGTIIRQANSATRGASYLISNLKAGAFTITIKDTINPIQTIVQTLTAPAKIVVERRVTGDQGSCNGSIILTPTGGVGNYTYQWNTGATSRDLFNLCCNDGRQYSVNVKDANGCQVSTPNDTIACNIAALTIASSTVRNAICQSDSLSSRIDVAIAGGVQPLTYEWRNQLGAVVGSNSPILTNQPPGRYYLVASDSRSPNPQKANFDALLKVTSTLGVGQVDIKCAPDNILPEGGITITINAGVAPYSVRWPDGSVSVTQTGVATSTTQKAGKGEVTVTDLNGCVVKKDVEVCSDACATIRTNTIFITPKETFNIKCAKNEDGGATVLSLSSTYRTPIRSYQWTSGEVGSTAFKLKPGFNQVTVTDADGKTCVSRIFMKAPPLRKDTGWVDDKARTLEAVPGGGVQPYTYLWTTTSADTSRKITVNRSGKYVVLTTDFLGCSEATPLEIVINATCLEGSVILTPNDDGRNENFRFKSCDIKKVRLEVYNRWGQVVYTSNDYRDQWYGNKEDGTSGEQLPEGVYMYVLTGVDASGKQQVGKGTVNIVRY